MTDLRNEPDSNGEAANVVKGLYEIAHGLYRNSEALARDDATVADALYAAAKAIRESERLPFEDAR